MLEDEGTKNSRSVPKRETFAYRDRVNKLKETFRRRIERAFLSCAGQRVLLPIYCTNHRRKPEDFSEIPSSWWHSPVPMPSEAFNDLHLHLCKSPTVGCKIKDRRKNSHAKDLLSMLMNLSHPSNAVCRSRKEILSREVHLIMQIALLRIGVIIIVISHHCVDLTNSCGAWKRKEKMFLASSECQQMKPDVFEDLIHRRTHIDILDAWERKKGLIRDLVASSPKAEKDSSRVRKSFCRCC